MPTLIFSFVLLWFFSQPASAFAKEWNGIIPLKSSRSDVGRILGLPDEMGGYQLKGIYVRIIYTPTCTGPYETCECLVGRDMVQRVSVAIRGELKIKSLHLNLKNYVRERDGHLLVYDTYADLDEGIVYTVFREDKTVTNITYLPSKEDCEEVLRKGSLLDFIYDFVPTAVQNDVVLNVISRRPDRSIIS